MIYGFGTREYLATGYKAEVTTGYSWGEFNDALYLGASYETGGFRRLGYIMGGFTLGSYIDLENGMWQRSAVDVDLRWFSNLFLFKRSRIRQFLAFNYTQGWNRATGSDESIRFTRTDGLQALKEYIIGTNRMILNTETVVFTPYQPLGFRIAVFGFADFGLIGYSPNIFKKRLLHLVRTGRAAAKRTAGVQHDPDPAGRGLRQTRAGRERIFPPFEPDAHGAVPLPTDAARDRRIQIGTHKKAEDSVESPAFVNFLSAYGFSFKPLPAGADLDHAVAPLLAVRFTASSPL